MNTIDRYLMLSANRLGRAVPRTALRHVHVEENPMVVIGFHLAGDEGAVLGLMWGTDPDNPHLIAVPEPRNRDLRYKGLTAFADSFLGYIDSIPSASAPQVIVPNVATGEWLFGLVGRFTRYETREPRPTPAQVVSTGRVLSFLYEQMILPGSSVVLRATEELGNHFINPQLNSENQNLYTQLAWMAPPAGMSGAAAAAAAEFELPAGPVTDPTWDSAVLEKAIERFHRAKEKNTEPRAVGEFTSALRSILTPGWDATWESVTHLRSQPEAAHVRTRWASDVTRWQKDIGLVRSSYPRFRIHPRPTGSAVLLSRLEAATQDLAFERAVDDPLVLARHVVRGEATTGTVLNSNIDRYITTATGRRQRSPVLTMQSDEDSPFVVSDEATLVNVPTVRVRVVEKVGRKLVFEVISGALRQPGLGKLPLQGSRVALCTLERAHGGRREPLPEVPWTHRAPESDATEEEVA